MDYEKMELVMRDGKGYLRPRQEVVQQEKIAPPPPKRKPDPSKRPLGVLLEVMSERLGIPEDEIRGPSRKRLHAYARFAVSLIAHDDMRMSLSQIGRLLGDRDHTTVLHGIRAAKKRNMISSSERREIMEEVFSRRGVPQWRD